VLKKRLVRLVTDALQLIEDNVFKLDADFDLLIDNTTIHILRPSGFEFVGRLQSAVLAAVPENVEAIRRDLGYVNYDSIKAYAGKHPRAARYLASIRSQEEFKNIDKAELKRHCKRTGVEIAEENGKIVVANDQIMGFLEVLDRRRYENTLIKDSPELFRALSRKKIANGAGGEV
jgi:hypothetical protein